MADGLDTAIAIVGMAARLPGARTPAEYWRNLAAGVESIVPLSEQQLLDAGVSREAMHRPGYVRAAAPLEHMDWFDADFFGFSPKDAAIMDPQHRQFLSACWEALEDAAHVPETFDGAIGVFAGSGMAAYFAHNILTNPDLVDSVGMFLLRHTGNDKDFLVTRASYLLDLQGPAVNVQTACSTSLVATHLAVQHLLSGECDMALAGGVTIEMPHGQGYQFQPDEILSPDGHCRAFDAAAGGTVFGSGVGVVVLRRLADAIADGDHVYAIIRGTAVNNDGARKVGYLAPSIDGQAACIAEALAVADVPSTTVQYVECHGTGTAMGDPIEVAALTQAFTKPVDGRAYCALGSVKTNIGHLDTAAGVAALIKTTLALQHQALPPSLHFRQPNPNIQFAGSPFEVNAALRDWPAPGATPRRAGVNSLGVGGTNAFAVLEEAPPQPAATPSAGPQLLVLSAKNRAALDEAAARLAAHLREHPDLDLGDVAFTLHAGRHQFAERRVLAATTVAEAADLLERNDQRRLFTHTAATTAPELVFLLPGGGAQYPRMAADLYTTEPVFRQHVDEGLRLAATHGLDLRPLLFPAEGDDTAAADALEHASVQLPCLLIVEHALAQLLLSWGVRPAALLGHSVGENVAACLAGTMTFADCMGLVALRGRLMDRTRGGMLSVPMAADELAPLLNRFDLDLGVLNAPDLCVASGADASLAALQEHLASIGIDAQRIRIHIAAHSRLLDPVLDEFRTFLRTIRLAAPQTPWLSNRTGTWITDSEATDPEYWVGQLRHTVRFADCVASATERWPRAVFVEVGPGKTLSSLTRMSPGFTAGHSAVHTMRHPDEPVADDVVLLTTLGRLWAAGGAFPAVPATRGTGRRRVSLPTYAFQEQRYFIEPGRRDAADTDELPLLDRLPTDDWFWQPVWRARGVDDDVIEPLTYLAFADQLGVTDGVASTLRAAGHRVVVVRVGDAYQQVGHDEYRLAAEHGRPGYDQLLADLLRNGALPDRVLHLALLADREDFRPGLSFFHRNQELGFYSLLFFMQAWAAEGLRRSLHLTVATANAQHVLATDQVLWPEQSTVLGPVLVVPHEVPGVTASTIDVSIRTAPPPSERIRRRAVAPPDHAELVAQLVAEATAPAENAVLAVRGAQRLVRTFRRATSQPARSLPLRAGAVVLVTGGLGGIGLTIAGRLHREAGARLVLLSREPLPDDAQWDRLLATLDPAHPTAQRLRGVRELRAQGAQVEVMHGDVTDIARMREVVAEVQQRFGGLHGVVHAAGVTDDQLLLAKEQADVDRVLAAKVYGTLVLHEVTATTPLDLFVVFSSTSAITGPAGQVDYVAANAFLNAFAQAHPERVRAISWGAWADTGMAVAAVRRLSTRGETSAALATSPWFTTRQVDDHGVIRLGTTWTDGDWFLDEHRTAVGQALLPGAAYLELARAALAEAGTTSAFELAELILLAPLATGDDGSAVVQVTLRPTDGGYAFEVAVQAPLAGAGQATESGSTTVPTGWAPTAQAQLLLRRPVEAATRDLAAAEAACPQRGALRSRQHDHLRFGPRWSVARRVQLGDHLAVAELSLPASFVGYRSITPLHPALLDIGLCFAIECVPGYTGDRLWVPVSMQSAVVHRPFVEGELLTVIASVAPSSSDASGFATFDVAFCSADGTVAVDVHGFTMKRLDGPLDLRVTAAAPIAAAGTARQLSRAELVFQHNVEQGIAAADGADAFIAALTRYDGPELIVSSLDLPALRQQMDAISAVTLRAAGGGDSEMAFARPNLAADYVAPRDAIEQTLAGLWQELLGVAQVGVHDSFFDLGGHSLIAVRLFTRLRKLYSVDLPMSVLFQAETVEAGAALIRSLLPAEDGTAPVTTAALPSRYTYLVPMHHRETPGATPFFLVAGMFGNVLNLRHLANQIGSERPFYGVQARGLFGGTAPHETFEDMAVAYLEEIRLVQPHGPYMLGGFSGGGITALEIAQRLRADGETVSLLVMLDTPSPSIKEALTTRDRVAIQLQDLRRYRLGYVTRWWRNRQAWQQAVADKAQSPTADDGALHSLEIEAAFYRAVGRYTVQPYGGAITLFRPPQHPRYRLPGDRQIDEGRNFVHADNGWRRHCADVTVTEVPGDHDSMVLEPNVRVLAGHIRAAIDRATRP